MIDKKREDFKAAVRRSVDAFRDGVVRQLENEVEHKERKAAFEVAAAIKVLRADDEGLLETQAEASCIKLTDERGRRRFGKAFKKYEIKEVELPPSWPWGISQGSATAILLRARRIKSRIKLAADPKAVALEAGSAFALAAASETDIQNVASLEDEARQFLLLATKCTEPKFVLRRAANITLLKEFMRRRNLLLPEQRTALDAANARLHARELAAERRRQRDRRKAAHLALLRDAVRTKGRPGRPGTRADPPDIQAAAVHAQGFLGLFSLHEKEDATDDEDEQDYPAFCRFLCGKKLCISAHSYKTTDSSIITAATQVINRDHAGQSMTTLTELCVPQKKTLEQAGMLPPPPTKDDLLNARRAALLTIIRFLQDHGIRHLDSALRDKDWVPLSQNHLGSNSLGTLADILCQVLEEYLSIRQVETQGDKELADLLTTVGVLCAKAGDIPRSRNFFCQAAEIQNKNSIDDIEKLEKISMKTKQAPDSGSFMLPGAGPRSKYFRFDKALRAQAKPIHPHIIDSWKSPIQPSALPSAPWRVLPFPKDRVAFAPSSILLRTHFPADIEDDELAAASSRKPIDPIDARENILLSPSSMSSSPESKKMYMRNVPYIYSSIHAAHRSHF